MPVSLGLCRPTYIPTLGAKSNKRCDRLNIFKTITVQKNPIVLTGCKRFSDITFLSSQISTFGMVIVCTGTYHRLRSVEIYVGLSFQCRRPSRRTPAGTAVPRYLTNILSSGVPFCTRHRSYLWAGVNLSPVPVHQIPEFLTGLCCSVPFRIRQNSEGFKIIAGN